MFPSRYLVNTHYPLTVRVCVRLRVRVRLCVHILPTRYRTICMMTHADVIEGAAHCGRDPPGNKEMVT